MKKLFLLLLVLPLVFSSCGGDDENSKTTYQIVNNFSYESDIQGLDGSMYDVIVFCFVGDNVVREDHYDKVASMSKSEIKEMPENFEKIKISFKLAQPGTPAGDLSSNTRKYTVSYTMIEKGKNNTIELTGNTMLQNTLKSSTHKEKSDYEMNIYSSIKLLHK